MRNFDDCTFINSTDTVKIHIYHSLHTDTMKIRIYHSLHTDTTKIHIYHSLHTDTIEIHITLNDAMEMIIITTISIIIIIRYYMAPCL